MMSGSSLRARPYSFCGCVALALILAGCGADSKLCKVFGVNIGEYYETYASNIALVDGGGNGDLILYAAGGRTRQWHAIDARGYVGPKLGEAMVNHYASSIGEWTHAVFAWELGFRVLRDRFAEYVIPNQTIERREYKSAGAPLPDSFSVSLPFMIHGEIYLIWTAPESTAAPETWLAGVGRLEQDERVVPIGAPFLRTTMTPNSFGLFLHGGGWDEQAGHFWIDHPDKKQVLKVSLDGTLLGAEPIAGDEPFPYLLNWVKLPSGRWVGQHSGWWLNFTPTERWKAQARPNTVPANSVGNFQQLLDRQGTLWIAGSADRQISIRRYDEAAQTLSEPVLSPLTVVSCALMLTLY